jgi:hypothetical protein
MRRHAGPESGRTPQSVQRSASGATEVAAADGARRTVVLREAAQIVDVGASVLERVHGSPFPYSTMGLTEASEGARPLSP